MITPRRQTGAAMGCYDTSPGQIGLRQLLPALLMLASAPASPVGPTWNMPGIQGNARDGAAPGINWTTNPREDSGGRWTAYHEVEGRFAPMVPGRAYGFLWALRESDDSFAPRNMLQGRRLQAASSDASHGRGPASLVTFTPARPGEFTVAIRGKLDIKQGAPTSTARVSIRVFDHSPAPQQEIGHEDVMSGGTFSWSGSVILKEGESVGLQLAASELPAGPSGWPTLDIESFSVTDVAGSRLTQTLPANPAAWRPRDPGVLVTPLPDGGMTIEIPAGTKEWYVLDGPTLRLPPRTRFNPDRAIHVTAEAWPEKVGDTPIKGYAMHLRAKMNGGAVTVPTTAPGASSPVSAYAQSPYARQIWDAAWELDGTDKMTSWTSADGQGRIAPSCERLDFELWVAVPRSAPAVVHLRDFQVRENFSDSHLFTPKPAALGNIFFAEKGTMNIEFARAGQIETWSVTSRDEENRVQKEVAGTGDPGPLVTLPLETMGLHRIEAKAVYRDGATLGSSTTAALVGEPLPDEIRLRSRFGTNRVHGNMPLWKKSGARWEWGIGKIHLKDWILEKDGTIHPPADWQPLRSAEGFTDLMSVGSLPAWLRRPGDTGGRHDVHPPKDWTLFEKLFEAFARANPDLKYFSSIDNEINAKWRGSSEEFIKWHQHLARGARRGNPAMVVSGPNDYCIDLEVFRRYIKGGMFGPDGLNGVNMHIYPTSPPEGEFMDLITGMVDLLQSNGLGDLPVYITEYGWFRGKDPRFYPLSDPTDHPRFVARSLALLAAQPVDAICWHSFRISGRKRDEADNGYNLLHADHTPTASYVAHVNAVQWLAEIKRGDGRWFRFSPRVQLVLGRTKDRIVGVAWSTRGEAPFELPAKPLRAADMMGRALPPRQQVTLSPSPMFFELPPDNDFIDLPERPPLTVYPGQSVGIGLDRLVAPDGIIAAGRNATVANDAVPGKYLIVGSEAQTGRRVAQPLHIPPPLVLRSLRPELASDCRKLQVVATLVPAIAGAVRATLTLDSGETWTTEAVTSPGEECDVRIPVPSFQPGQRIQGKILIETTGEISFAVGGNIDTSAIPAVRVDDHLDWNRIPAFDFSTWAPSSDSPPAEDDCSATVQAAVLSEGLHIRATVTDNEHRQTRPLRAIWEEDSVQLAFDVDAEKPWLLNLIMDGSFQGHRIFYYDVCLPTDGRETIVWRNRADSPGFGPASLAPEVAADIRREGSRTVYDIVFPWRSLGLDQAPPVGAQLGFSIVVNDSDKGHDRKFLRFGHGIAGPQNPEFFAILKIVAAGSGH
jgi:hypothetical protein